MFCDYGCGKEAIIFFKCVKRWCCSNSVNSCPTIREKNSHANLGVPRVWKNRIHPRGMLGKRSWNAGKQTPAEIREKLSQAAINNPKYRGRASSPEKEELRRQHIRDAAKRSGKMGGYREGSGLAKWFLYESPYAGKVFLNGTWEVAYAQHLDVSGINWRRNRCGFPYIWEGKSHKYYPDFHLIDTNEFVEVKGRIVPKDFAKWDALRKFHKLIVIQREDLIKLGVLK